MTEDEMAGWHHWLDGHEFEWTPGVGDGQGGLACCDSWGHKESARLSDWTDMNWSCLCLLTYLDPFLLFYTVPGTFFFLLFPFLFFPPLNLSSLFFFIDWVSLASHFFFFLLLVWKCTFGFKYFKGYSSDLSVQYLYIVLLSHFSSVRLCATS